MLLKWMTSDCLLCSNGIVPRDQVKVISELKITFLSARIRSLTKPLLRAEEGGGGCQSLYLEICRVCSRLLKFAPSLSSGDGSGGGVATKRS